MATSLDAEPLEQVTLGELCRACGVSAELVTEMVEQGILVPVGEDSTGPCFPAIAVRRVRIFCRLQRDLGINQAGAGLALELLEELRQLRARIRVLEGQGAGRQPMKRANAMLAAIPGRYFYSWPRSASAR